jgi:hypothetical protein
LFNNIDKFLDRAGVGVLWSRIIEEITKVDNKTSTITSKVDIIDDKIEKIIDDKNFDELKMLVEANIVNILSDNNNTILTDNDEKIYVL